MNRKKFGRQPNKIKEVTRYVAEGNWSALVKIGEPAVNALAEVLNDFRWYVAWGARSALIQIGPPAVDALIQALRNGSFLAPEYAAEALGNIGDPKAIEPLMDVLASCFPHRALTGVAKEAASALGKIGDPKAIPVLTSALQFVGLRDYAHEALELIHQECPERGAERYRKYLSIRSGEVFKDRSRKRGEVKLIFAPDDSSADDFSKHLMSVRGFSRSEILWLTNEPYFPRVEKEFNNRDWHHTYWIIGTLDNVARLKDILVKRLPIETRRVIVHAQWPEELFSEKGKAILAFLEESGYSVSVMDRYPIGRSELLNHKM